MRNLLGDIELNELSSEDIQFLKNMNENLTNFINKIVINEKIEFNFIGNMILVAQT